MRAIIISLFLSLIIFQPGPQSSKEIILLSTQKGSQRLQKSDYNSAFWKLSLYFDTQRMPTFCGVATGIMVLNALEIERPSWRENSQFKLFMQDHFFTPEVNEIVTEPIVVEKGISLPQLAAALRSFNTNVEIHSDTHLDVKLFRQTVKNSLRDANQYVIVNFHREVVGQIGTGHFAPVAAYDSASDSVLVMDVARYKYPPAWIPVEQLVKGMETIDDDSGQTRGWLVVRK